MTWGDRWVRLFTSPLHRGGARGWEPYSGAQANLQCFCSWSAALALAGTGRGPAVRCAGTEGCPTHSEGKAASRHRAYTPFHSDCGRPEWWGANAHAGTPGSPAQRPLLLARQRTKHHTPPPCLQPACWNRSWRRLHGTASTQDQLLLTSGETAVSSNS